MKSGYCLLAATVLLLCASPLSAEDLNYNIIHLSAEAEQRVDNDLLVATMSASAETQTARQAATAVNENMSWAAALIRAVPAITSQTMNYQTHPLYKNRAIVGWAASQQVRLESRSIEELTGLIGRLQEKLTVAALRFEVSVERRQASIDEIVSRALEAFRTKAGLVATSLGAVDYRIVSITIGENDPPVPFYRGRQMEAMSMDTAMAEAPAVEAGESNIRVRAEGSIQLVF